MIHLRRGNQTMSFITEIYDRVNMQHIREFLLYGVECRNIQNDNYETRIENMEKNYRKMLLEHMTDLKEDSKLYSELISLLGEYGDIYMEIGIQIGTMLMDEFKNIQGRRT